MKTKYPRTYHLPFSPGVSSDDKIIKNYLGFIGQEVVITEKMDGENTSLYRDYLHARSLDSGNHPSRDWIKGWHSTLRHNIPIEWRICGENLYAKHSIQYTLPSYFLAFSVWEGDICKNWDETLEILQLLDIHHVPILFRGSWDDASIFMQELAKKIDTKNMEGFVVRVTREFLYSEFDSVVAKFVRKNHVQTDEHWKSAPIIPNNIISNMA